jgi:hypothetical protein
MMSSFRAPVLSGWVLMAAFCVAAPRIAQAQMYWGPPSLRSWDYPEPEYSNGPRVSRAAIAEQLSKRGYRLIGPLRREDAIVAIAADAHGEKVRVFIDPDDGAILEKRSAANNAPPASVADRPSSDEITGTIRSEHSKAAVKRQASVAQPKQTAKLTAKPSTAQTPAPASSVAAAPTARKPDAGVAGRHAVMPSPAANLPAEPPALSPQPVAAQPPAPITTAPIPTATAPAQSGIPPILQSYQGLKPPPGAESAQRPDGG